MLTVDELIIHHGARDSVTGSCHELRLPGGKGILIDCGLFQGQEANRPLEIDFPVEHLLGLIVTHVHIDHIGRLPYLLAAGFNGPIYCSEASALLIPEVLQDALKIGFTRDNRQIEHFLDLIAKRLRPLPYKVWQEIKTRSAETLKIRLQPAGHILGSAYVECCIEQLVSPKSQRILFTGDLGAPYAPLLPAPKPPYSAELVVMESTYGNRCHEGRKERKDKLQQVIEMALEDRGVVLIPAFSIGRTQELLYEIEELIYRNRRQFAARNLPWQELEIVVDSPLASRFTALYRQLNPGLTINRIF